MKDVAALAGVGVKTVSRVMNEEPNVSPETTARVRRAVAALDYQLDLGAGSLRRGDGRTRTLGLLVGSVDNPFCGAIHRGVEDAAMPRGVAVFASSLDDDPTREEAAVRAFLQRRVDGLLLTTTRTRPGQLDRRADLGVPTVYIDHRPEGAAVDSVTSDNREGARRATEHLIAHGHRRIAMLGDSTDLQTARERQRGFREAVAAAGIPAMVAPNVMDLRGERAAHDEAVGLLGSTEPPTAIFSAQNLLTAGAVHALRELGLARRVALVGFDDIPLADVLSPGISVVAQDPHEIGRVATERLFARLDGDTGEARHVVVPTTLIPRGSGEIAPDGVNGA